jgi:hypothetical protein
MKVMYLTISSRWTPGRGIIQKANSLMQQEDVSNGSAFCGREKSNIGDLRIGLIAAPGTTVANRKPIRFVRSYFGRKYAEPSVRSSVDDPGQER